MIIQVTAENIGMVFWTQCTCYKTYSVTVSVSEELAQCEQHPFPQWINKG